MDSAAFSAPILPDGPAFLTLGLVLVAAGVLIAVLILVFGVRAAARRRATEDELEARGEAHYVGSEVSVAPPIATAPPPPPVAPVPEPAPEPAPVPEPMPQPAPEPEPAASEPIPAAAPMDASPASLAADLTAQPAPEAPIPTPAAPPPADDLTRMKGVGPRLAERLNAAGIASFAQLAALSPEEAESLDARLGDFRGRIHRDRWIEQARLLAAGDTAAYEATFGKL